jgi:hypothetical protein
MPATRQISTLFWLALLKRQTGGQELLPIDHARMLVIWRFVLHTMGICDL